MGGGASVIKERTFRLVFPLVDEQKTKEPKRRKSDRTYPNPIITSLEWKRVLETDGITITELARRLGISQPRVSQMLRLLRLHPDLIRDIVAIGRVMTRPVKIRRLLTIVDQPLSEQKELFKSLK